MSSWVQPSGDVDRRVDIPHATAAAQDWTLDGTYVFFEGRTYPVGARGTFVTSVWSVSAIWNTGERAEAEAFIELLRTVALEADARLDVHVSDPANGTAVEFVGEVHQIPQALAPGQTTVEVAFTQVDSG